MHIKVLLDVESSLAYSQSLRYPRELGHFSYSSSSLLQILFSELFLQYSNPLVILPISPQPASVQDTSSPFPVTPLHPSNWCKTLGGMYNLPWHADSQLTKGCVKHTRRKWSETISNCNTKLVVSNQDFWARTHCSKGVEIHHHLWLCATASLTTSKLDLQILTTAKGELVVIY